MAWGKRQKITDRALAEGELEVAIEQLREDRFRKTFTGRRLSRRVTGALLDRAENSMGLGHLAAAWSDLTTANKMAQPNEVDRVSRRMNQLVELTVEAAESLLSNAKTTHAIQMINQLSRRKIMDWRADRIRNVVQCLQDAEELSAAGKFAQAIEQLDKAKNLQPNLPFIDSRLAAGRQREIQMKELTEELQSTALKCQWADVNQCCQKILMIAPKHQIALDAQRHCSNQMKRKTSAGVRITSVPDRSRLSQSNSFFQFGNATRKSESQRDTATGVSTDTVSEMPSRETFMLWVDGVGGYLVCTDRVNTIGQAAQETRIAIPVVGDLRGRHARIESVGGQHLLQPLGGMSIDGAPVQSPVELKHDQTFLLDGGVSFKYSQSHPLSKSARLDCVSRHRTQPWADAILLATQSIVLGPNRNNHVFCPTWENDLILFCRNDQWFCRTTVPIEIDNQTVGKEGPIQFNSRIVGEDFSLTLERVP